MRSPGSPGIGDTCRVKLLDYIDSARQVLGHPWHQAAQEFLVELIEQLRACANVKDGYEFQQALLTHVLTVEDARKACSWAVKRMDDGRPRLRRRRRSTLSSTRPASRPRTPSAWKSASSRYGMDAALHLALDEPMPVGRLCSWFKVSLLFLDNQPHQCR